MSSTTTITLSPQAQAILRRTQYFVPVMAEAVARAVDRENELTIGEIQRLRLSRRGPDTLGVVTNRLRSSVSRAPAVISADRRRVVSSIGSNVRYAGVHEYGFKGPVYVRHHQRRTFGTFTTGGVAVLDPRTGRIRKQRKRTIQLTTGTTFVRGHTRLVDIKARAPFRRGIAARAGAYSTAISAAIVGAWEGRTP